MIILDKGIVTMLDFDCLSKCKHGRYNGLVVFGICIQLPLVWERESAGDEYPGGLR